MPEKKEFTLNQVRKIADDAIKLISARVDGDDKLISCVLDECIHHGEAKLNIRDEHGLLRRGSFS